ncbi:uncharacterized protein Dmul_32840 [Desulfococcus multivorans]|nr:uncharacterized protein Dmul_32840 [Desulfococcus multivorans]
MLFGPFSGIFSLNPPHAFRNIVLTLMPASFTSESSEASYYFEL